MKRLILTAAALGSLWLISATAGAQTQGTAAPTVAKPGAFVDADGDGRCDNWTGARKGAGRGMQRGQGAATQRGPGAGPRDGSGYRRGEGRADCTRTCPRGRGRSGR